MTQNEIIEKITKYIGTFIAKNCNKNDLMKFGTEVEELENVIKNIQNTIDNVNDDAELVTKLREYKMKKEQELNNLTSSTKMFEVLLGGKDKPARTMSVMDFVNEINSGKNVSLKKTKTKSTSSSSSSSSSGGCGSSSSYSGCGSSSSSYSYSGCGSGGYYRSGGC